MDSNIALCSRVQSGFALRMSQKLYSKVIMTAVTWMGRNFAPHFSADEAKERLGKKKTVESRTVIQTPIAMVSDRQAGSLVVGMGIKRAGPFIYRQMTLPGFFLTGPMLRRRGHSQMRELAAKSFARLAGERRRQPR
jgi:hypothetical protein